MTRLEDIVRQRFTPRDPTTRRLGIELEVIPLRAESGLPVLPRSDVAGPGTADVLRALGKRLGWHETETGYGVPHFSLGDGGAISYEPGGQIEWSSPAYDDPTALDDALRTTCKGLADAMADAGIVLLSRGVDPRTSLDAATQVMTGERYRRQRLHYDRIGSAGRSMMLQTAGIHINVDPCDAPGEGWIAANALAPILVATFANSPERAGGGVSHRSHRAAIWRTLDPSRTAIFGAANEPVASYMAFALGAGSFLLGEADAPARSFGEWHADGANNDDFARHLTTLFPEVRPRGDYLEIRSVDALPARQAIVPAAVAWAAIHHAPLRREIIREIETPSVERLSVASRLGLGDPSLAAEAKWLAERATSALEVLLPRHDAGRRLVRRVQDFFAEYTMLGRDPGCIPESRLES